MNHGPYDERPAAQLLRRDLPMIRRIEATYDRAARVEQLERSIVIARAARTANRWRLISLGVWFLAAVAAVVWVGMIAAMVLG